VHPVGAPHLLNPEKLLASAKRIYGDMMEPLWGEFLPVPEDNISIPKNEDVIKINELEFKVIDTPGHANHHYVYIFEDICFSGDIGGVRLRGSHHISLPMPPPDLNLESWVESLNRLREEHFSYIAPTHFDIYGDAEWHMDALEQALDEAKAWLEETMPIQLPIEELRNRITAWEHQRLIRSGLANGHEFAQYTANPPFMSADGVFRYWQKYRTRNEG
jgi:glyoxylase-like metal-dependent hydrolase (beta-lactamase superfamily II)